MTNLVDAIVAYETGELDDAATVDLFADLVRTGQAWALQGHYGRTAAGLIDAGILTPAGEITDDAHGVLASERPCLT